MATLSSTNLVKFLWPCARKSCATPSPRTPPLPAVPSTLGHQTWHGMGTGQPLTSRQALSRSTHTGPSKDIVRHDRGSEHGPTMTRQRPDSYACMWVQVYICHLRAWDILGVCSISLNPRPGPDFTKCIYSWRTYAKYAVKV